LGGGPRGGEVPGTPPRQTLTETATCDNRLSGESRHHEQARQDRSQLIAMARAELEAHLDCPEGILIAVLRDGDSWEFRAEADESTVAKPGYPECVAMLVQIGDHLSKQYDVS
jgi:hypothetical protein